MSCDGEVDGTTTGSPVGDTVCLVGLVVVVGAVGTPLHHIPVVDFVVVVVTEGCAVVVVVVVVTVVSAAVVVVLSSVVSAVVVVLLIPPLGSGWGLTGGRFGSISAVAATATQAAAATAIGTIRRRGRLGVLAVASVSQAAKICPRNVGGTGTLYTDSRSCFISSSPLCVYVVTEQLPSFLQPHFHRRLVEVKL